MKRRIRKYRKRILAIALLRTPSPGALKKKRGATLTPEKPEGSERVYCIIEVTTYESSV